MGKEERLAALQGRSDAALVDRARLLVGDEHHDDVGRARRFSHRADVQLLRAGPLPRLSTRAQPHEHARADTRIPQVERMRVTLAAVSDDGDNAVLQPGRIGVGIVENTRFRRAHRFASVG